MKRKAKKKKNKSDEIIELLKEILAELKKLNENTNNGKLEKEWQEIFPDNDSTANYPYNNVYYSCYQL